MRFLTEFSLFSFQCSFIQKHAVRLMSPFPIHTHISIYMCVCKHHLRCFKIDSLEQHNCFKIICDNISHEDYNFYHLYLKNLRMSRM